MNLFRKKRICNLPRKWSIITISFNILIYILTENIGVTLLNLSFFIFFGILKTKQNKYWAKSILNLPIIGKTIIVMYIPLLAGIVMKIINNL